ncbi:MAG: hypothetical protein RBR67_04490 [Desulfobacterium sp.]|jgi:3',5'-cyclic AMP phosphodiesterase CpdA|nr:hypothetical protein [Desulfobacterium sp.]
MIRILHSGPPFIPTVGNALLQSAALLKPDVVVVSGDLTQRAKPDQFEAAKNFLEQLPRAPKVKEFSELKNSLCLN